jgi:hypothetical protein
MSKPLIIKLARNSVYDPNDYGPKFEAYLDRLVGKQGWQQPPNDHRRGKVEGTTIIVQRCEDGPEFWFNVANGEGSERTEIRTNPHAALASRNTGRWFPPAERAATQADSQGFVRKVRLSTKSRLAG